jgi:hypothetical protein
VVLIELISAVVVDGDEKVIIGVVNVADLVDNVVVTVIF